jgi:CDP-paratose 2-epimerase
MKILVTGGAGFTGCNLVKRLMGLGHEVIIFDCLSRLGAELNLKWLRTLGRFEFVKGDVRRADQVLSVFQRFPRIDAVIHLAAQVAVTSSVANPREDFEVNALGTLNVLEAARVQVRSPMILYASTNKVYGKMQGVTVLDNGESYEFQDLDFGVDESFPLDFRSPYACSKGAADQYVREYASLYGLRTVVFRQSCIYGPRQFGVEDQGWVAWFTISAVLGKPVTIYGSGKQVRDILHVDDLVEAYLAGIERIDRVQGEIYNLGGSLKSQLSLLGLVRQLNYLTGGAMSYSFADPRSGDQPIFISDIRKAKSDLDWEPRIGTEEGISCLYHWVRANRESIQRVYLPVMADKINEGKRQYMILG